MQPLDSLVNRAFKRNVRKRYQEWLFKNIYNFGESEALTSTKKDILKNPTKDEIISFIFDSFEEIDPQIIKTSKLLVSYNLFTFRL